MHKRDRETCVVCGKTATDLVVHTSGLSAACCLNCFRRIFGQTEDGPPENVLTR